MPKNSTLTYIKFIIFIYIVRVHLISSHLIYGIDFNLFFILDYYEIVIIIIIICALDGFNKFSVTNLTKLSRLNVNPTRKTAENLIVNSRLLKREIKNLIFNQSHVNYVNLHSLIGFNFFLNFMLILQTYLSFKKVLLAEKQTTTKSNESIEI